jgi:hypothetical protein
MLTIAAWLTAARRASSGTLSVLMVGSMISALLFFIRGQVPPAYPPATIAEFRQVNTIADHIFSHARAAKLSQPKVAVDYITDAFDGQVLRVVCYERHHVWLPFEMTLPTGIDEPTDAVVTERLARSDFVFLTEEAPIGPFPFDRKLAALRPQLRAWCEANLRATEHFTVFGRRMVLYQRREIPFP